MVVQGASASDYAHARCNCTLKRWSPAPAAANALTCANCYCFVCDAPAADCRRWRPDPEPEPQQPAGGATGGGGHCNADDKSERWQSVRRAAKHAWLRASPLYAALGTACYGAGAEDFAAVLRALEAYGTSPNTPR